MSTEGSYKLFIFSESQALVFLKFNLILIDISLLVTSMRVIWQFYLIKSIFLNQILLNSFLRILDIVYSNSIFRHLESY